MSLSMTACYLVRVEKQFFSGSIGIFFDQTWLKSPPPCGHIQVSVLALTGLDITFIKISLYHAGTRDQLSIHKIRSYFLLLRGCLIAFRMSASIIGHAKDNYNLYYNTVCRLCFPRCFDAVGSATGNASDIKNSLSQRSLPFVLLKVKKVLYSC